jgi:hypothetical protein
MYHGPLGVSGQPAKTRRPRALPVSMHLDNATPARRADWGTAPFAWIQTRVVARQAWSFCLVAIARLRSLRPSRRAAPNRPKQQRLLPGPPLRGAHTGRRALPRRPSSRWVLASAGAGSTPTSTASQRLDRHPSPSLVATHRVRPRPPSKAPSACHRHHPAIGLQRTLRPSRRPLAPRARAAWPSRLIRLRSDSTRSHTSQRPTPARAFRRNDDHAQPRFDGNRGSPLRLLHSERSGVDPTATMSSRREGLL